jgi:hypothetical protein
MADAVRQQDAGRACRHGENFDLRQPGGRGSWAAPTRGVCGCHELLAQLAREEVVDGDHRRVQVVHPHARPLQVHSHELVGQQLSVGSWVVAARRLGGGQRAGARVGQGDQRV